jgi:hypothetical protein
MLNRIYEYIYTWAYTQHAVIHTYIYKAQVICSSTIGLGHAGMLFAMSHFISQQFKSHRAAGPEAPLAFQEDRIKSTI